MQQRWLGFVQYPVLHTNLETTNITLYTFKDSNRYIFDNMSIVLNECVLMQSALYSCALDGDAGPVASGGGVTGCTSANLPEGYVTDETKELSHAKRRHVQ